MHGFIKHYMIVADTAHGRRAGKGKRNIHLFERTCVLAVWQGRVARGSSRASDGCAHTRPSHAHAGTWVSSAGEGAGDASRVALKRAAAPAATNRNTADAMAR